MAKLYYIKHSHNWNQMQCNKSSKNGSADPPALPKEDDNGLQPYFLEPKWLDPSNAAVNSNDV